jgi:hypothetical protein
MRVLGFIAVTALLSGCLASDEAVQLTARSAAKGVIKSVMADKLPGVNADVVVDCVVDQATTDQLIYIAKAAVTGVDDSTVNTITSIATKPETLSCIAQTELSGLLG